VVFGGGARRRSRVPCDGGRGGEGSDGLGLFAIALLEVRVAMTAWRGMTVLEEPKQWCENGSDVVSRRQSR